MFIKSPSIPDISGSSVLSIQDYIAKKSEFDVGDELIRVQRLRYRNDDPIVFVDGYYRACDIQGIEKYDLEKESMFYILEKHYGIKVMHTKKSFMARIVEDKYAEYLSIKKKSAVQYVESKEYDQQDRFVAFDISIFVGEKNIFEAEINNLPKALQ